jgi:toxin ParE1/3/4
VRSVRTHPEADREIIEGARYLEFQREECGNAFLDEVFESFVRLCRDPELWSIQLHGFRKYVVQRFGYLIWYRESGEEIYIIAVHHSSRKPGYWKDRILDEQR